MLKLNNFVNRVSERLKIEMDLHSWKRSVRRLKSAKSQHPTKRVLFCGLMTMAATAKIDALYAAALRKKGYQSVVLLMDRAPYIEKIFTALLPDVEFVYLTPLLQDDKTEDAEKIISGLNNSEDILSLEYHDCRVGKNSLSYAVRRLRVGTLDLQNSKHRNVFLDVLKRSLNVAEQSQKLVKDLNINLAVFLERGYTPTGEFFDACLFQNIRTVQWLGAPQSDSLIFKGYSKGNQSVHPLALSDQTWDMINSTPNWWSEEKNNAVIEKMKGHYHSGAWYNRQQLQAGKKLKSGPEILQELGLDLGKKTAIVFSHIFYDATFFYGESLYSDYKKWLVETIRYAIQNDNLNWIVKVHPVNVWRSEMDGVKMEQLEALALHEEFGELPNHIKIMSADTDVNTFSLFEFADYGLTVRGTIGMEFPCFSIPVVTAGSGRYNDRGFTIDPQSIDEYKKILWDLHNIEKLDERVTDLARRYAYGTFFLRPILMESYTLDFHANTLGSKALRQNTFVNKEEMMAWPQVGDLTQKVEWMISSSEELLRTDQGIYK